MKLGFVNSAGYVIMLVILLLAVDQATNITNLQEVNVESVVK
jgi:hypothetical protein